MTKFLIISAAVGTIVAVGAIRLIEGVAARAKGVV